MKIDESSRCSDKIIVIGLFLYRFAWFGMYTSFTILMFGYAVC